LELKAITPPPLPLRGGKAVGAAVGGTAVAVGRVRVAVRGTGGTEVAVGGAGVAVGMGVGCAGSQPVKMSEISRMLVMTVVSLNMLSSPREW
jgi:hypothetical protein